ncbi:hypothetical protein EVAR_61111_1 [Eumeta japonica]|uniref:Uncharacterized protein n=1 Tax=Eumeta variegata TaxID=151549 RepID=A0A4C1YR55_EUMVA|nr:hypothetical protein EVAR_61111_1 [Eumeta japonica]
MEPARHHSFCCSSREKSLRDKVSAATDVASRIIIYPSRSIRVGGRAPRPAPPTARPGPSADSGEGLLGQISHVAYPEAAAHGLRRRYVIN